VLNSESPVAIAAQALVAMALIVAASWLAYLDPAQRGPLGGALLIAMGSAATWFFSQRTQVATAHMVTNSMATMATQVAASTPGPAGAAGPTGPRGPAGPQQEAPPP
jgi:hypothetical protein